MRQESIPTPFESEPPSVQIAHQITTHDPTFITHQPYIEQSLFSANSPILRHPRFSSTMYISQMGLGCTEFLQWTVRVDQDLGVSVFPLVKLVVCNLCVVDGDLMRDHEAGLGLAGNDEIAQVPVVGLDVTLAGCERQAL